MSKIFYDQIIELEKIEQIINSTPISHEEKLEFWEIIDGITHYRVVHRILKVLPEKHHKTFLLRFEQAPYDHEIIDFLNDKSGANIIEEIAKESRLITQDLLQILCFLDVKNKNKRMANKSGKRS